MSEGNQVTVDSSRYQQKLWELKGLLRGVEIQDILKGEAKQVLTSILRITPPYNSSGGGQGASVGKKAVKRDIWRTMRPVDPKEFNRSLRVYETVKKASAKGRADELTAIFANFKGGPLKGAQVVPFAQDRHTSNRDGRGHVSRSLRPGIVVGFDKKSLASYVALVQSRVGFVKSGFKKSMEALGIEVPEYVARQNGPGAFETKLTDTDFSLTMTNGANLIPQLDSRIKSVMDGRAQAIATKISRLVQGKVTNLGFMNYDPSKQ